MLSRVVRTHDALGITRPDPLLCNIDLHLRRAFHPVGFRLHLATNSREVMEAAAECWRDYEPEFACEPMELRVVVEAEGPRAVQPRFRMQNSLLSIVSDSHNFAAIDVNAQMAAIYVTSATAADHTLLRWSFLESIAYTLLAQRYLAPLHAASVARGETAILLCGESGAGKSTLSFAAACAGWTYLSDDCTWLLAGSADAVAIGKPHQARFRDDAPELFPQLGDYGSRERPNGKLSIEVPMRAFPEIRTALRCRVGGLAWLDRGPRARPALQQVEPDAVARQLLNSCSYGEKVDAMHERATGRLLHLPACRLRYESLEDGLRLLADFSEAIGIRPDTGSAA